jgi:hypothetical protein
MFEIWWLHTARTALAAHCAGMATTNNLFASDTPVAGSLCPMTEQKDLDQH